MRTFNSQAFPCRPTFHSHNNFFGISAPGFPLSYLTNPPVAFHKKTPTNKQTSCFPMTSSKYIGLQRKQTKSKYQVPPLFSDFFFLSSCNCTFSNLIHGQFTPNTWLCLTLILPNILPLQFLCIS